MTYRLRHLLTTTAAKVTVDPELGRVDLEDVDSGTGRVVTGLEVRRQRVGEGVAFEPGDVLFGKLRPYLRKGFLAETLGCCSPEFLVMRPRRDLLDPKFLYYLVHSDRFIAWAVATSKGVKMPRTDFESLSEYRTEVPTLDEQRRMVARLDREMGFLDVLELGKQRTFSLLDERQRAYRHRMCTGARKADLVATGFANLPFAPRSWTTTRLARTDCVVQTGPFGSQLHADEYVKGGFPVVNPQNLQRGRIVAIEGLAIDGSTRARLSHHVLRTGDVVFARRGELGRAALVEPGQHGWVCGTGCLRIRFRSPTFSPRYLAYFLQLDVVRQYFESVSVGSTMENLNTRILLAMPLLIPPLDEQDRIADAMDAATERATALDATLRRQLDLLAERRRALIASVVEGVGGEV